MKLLSMENMILETFTIRIDYFIY